MQVIVVNTHKIFGDPLQYRDELAERLGFTDLDQQLMSFVAPRLGNGAVKLLVLLTKADKLNRREAAAALAGAQIVLGEQANDAADVAVARASAVRKSRLRYDAQGRGGRGRG